MNKIIKDLNYRASLIEKTISEDNISKEKEIFILKGLLDINNIVSMLEGSNLFEEAVSIQKKLSSNLAKNCFFEHYHDIDTGERIAFNSKDILELNKVTFDDYLELAGGFNLEGEISGSYEDEKLIKDFLSKYDKEAYKIYDDIKKNVYYFKADHYISGEFVKPKIYINTLNLPKLLQGVTLVHEIGHFMNEKTIKPASYELESMTYEYNYIRYLENHISREDYQSLIADYIECFNSTSIFINNPYEHYINEEDSIAYYNGCLAAIETYDENLKEAKKNLDSYRNSNIYSNLKKKTQNTAKVLVKEYKKR